MVVVLEYTVLASRLHKKGLIYLDLFLELFGFGLDVPEVDDFDWTFPEAFLLDDDSVD